MSRKFAISAVALVAILLASAASATLPGPIYKWYALQNSNDLDAHARAARGPVALKIEQHARRIRGQRAHVELDVGPVRRARVSQHQDFARAEVGVRRRRARVGVGERVDRCGWNDRLYDSVYGR